MIALNAITGFFWGVHTQKAGVFFEPWPRTRLKEDGRFSAPVNMKVFAYAAILLAVSVAYIYAQVGVYGNISEADYLIGKFDATRHPELFTQITEIPTSYQMYMRQDAYKAFKSLYHDLLADNPSLPRNLPVVSALRNLTYQGGIWNRKWTGAYANITNPVVRGLGIMEWSAMPGTSRHHWGTDLDFYSLENGDFEHGNGLIIYSWMKANAARYGFCQPYTAGRCAGYNEERWHWSFVPVSSGLRQAWNTVYGDTTICNWASKVDFQGAKSVSILASAYVNTINLDCM